MNDSQFECRWCGRPAVEHGKPGASALGGPKDRLCPVYGVTSQFFAPRILDTLQTVRRELRDALKHMERLQNTLALIEEAIDA